MLGRADGRLSMTQVERLQSRLTELDARIGGITIAPGARPTASELAAEINDALDAIDRGEYEPINPARMFGDTLPPLTPEAQERWDAHVRDCDAAHALAIAERDAKRAAHEARQLTAPVVRMEQ